MNATMQGHFTWERSRACRPEAIPLRRQPAISPAPSIETGGVPLPAAVRRSNAENAYAFSWDAYYASERAEQPL